MQEAARGDAQAFEQIVRRHQGAAWNVASRFLKDSHAAADVVQEAFVRVWEAAPRYQPCAQFRAYLLRVVSRLCLDHIRRKKPLPMEDIPEPTDSRPTVMDNVLERERAVAVRAAIEKLPERQRLAIILRYYEHCGYKEIAVVLEITEKAAERLLARGREALEVLLKDWE